MLFIEFFYCVFLAHNDTDWSAWCVSLKSSASLCSDDAMSGDGGVTHTLEVLGLREFVKRHGEFGGLSQSFVVVLSTVDARCTDGVVPESIPPGIEVRDRG